MRVCTCVRVYGQAGVQVHTCKQAWGSFHAAGTVTWVHLPVGLGGLTCPCGSGCVCVRATRAGAGGRGPCPRVPVCSRMYAGLVCTCVHRTGGVLGSALPLTDTDGSARERVSVCASTSLGRSQLVPLLSQELLLSTAIRGVGGELPTAEKGRGSKLGSPGSPGLSHA